MNQLKYKLFEMLKELPAMVLVQKTQILYLRDEYRLRKLPKIPLIYLKVIESACYKITM